MKVSRDAEVIEMSKMMVFNASESVFEGRGVMSSVISKCSD